MNEFDLEFAQKPSKKGKKTPKGKKEKQKVPTESTDNKDKVDEEEQPEEVKIKDPVKIKKAGTNVIALGLGTHVNYSVTPHEC